jgi:sugar lactone lactonase YvrE
MSLLAIVAAALLAQENEEASAPTRIGMYAETTAAARAVTGVAFDDRGGLWICESDARRLVRLVDGARERVFELPEAALLSDVAIHRESVFAACMDGVLELDLEGRTLRKFGSWGRGAGQVRCPAGIAVNHDFVFVADTGNDRVVRFSHATGEAITFGTQGHGQGELLRPEDVAVDTDGFLYVSDSGNHRVVKLDRDLHWVKTWGDFGPHPGFFSQPEGLAWDDGTLYVVDSDNHRVQTFDAEGQRIHEWGLHALLPREGEGKLHYPHSIAVRDGRAAVSEPVENRVQWFRPTQPGEEIPVPMQFERVVSAHFGGHLSVAGEIAAVCEPTAPSFLLYDVKHSLAKWEPVLVGRTSDWGRRAGQMLAPVDIEVNWERRCVLVADADARRISLWSFDHDETKPLEFDFFKARLVRSLDFASLHALGADGAQEPIRPDAIELGPQGQWLVLDTLQRAMFVASADLRKVTRVPAAVDALGAHPVDVAWSEWMQESAWVVDDVARELREVKLDGRAGASTHAAESVGSRPSAIAAGRDLSLWITDSGDAVVRRFRCPQAGFPVLEASWGRPGVGALEFQRPRGLDVDEQGRVWVVDWGNHRVQVISGDGEFIVAFGARAFVRPTLGGS